MNWIPPEYGAEVEFQNVGEFIQSNSQYHGTSNFQSKFTDLNQQRKNDRDFINNFILHKEEKQIELKNNNNNNKISHAKSILLEIISEKQKIERNVLNLNVKDENFDLSSEALMTELNKLNKRILKFDLEVKIPLATALKKRLKKRTAIKKRKEKLKAFKKIQQEEIQNKHKIIDKILNERSEEVEVIKHEAALKRQADSVLHEVRKKKNEAKKMLNLLVALAKLRELRSKEEEKLGGYCSKQLTDTFNKVMERFQNLWEKQLEVYKLEEKGLKIMLEENTLPHKKESQLETNLLQWEKVLFGDVADNEYEKLLTFAETDIQALIQVRQAWDQFLTTEATPMHQGMASSIPLGWVLPPETEDESWKACTKSNKKTSP